MSKTAKLAADVVSVFYDKKGGQPKVYGKRNEEVTLISQFDEMWIVENKKKERYSVNATNLITQS